MFIYYILYVTKYYACFPIYFAPFTTSSSAACFGLSHIFVFLYICSIIGHVKLWSGFNSLKFTRRCKNGDRFTWRYTCVSISLSLSLSDVYMHVYLSLMNDSLSLYLKLFMQCLSYFPKYNKNRALNVYPSMYIIPSLLTRFIDTYFQMYLCITSSHILLPLSRCNW
jgi:hypothetical protein